MNGEKPDLKTEFSKECDKCVDCGTVKFKGTFSTGDQSLEYGLTTKKGDIEGSTNLELESTPDSGDWSAKFDMKCGGYDMGPLKGYTGVSTINIPFLVFLHTILTSFKTF